MNFPHNTNFFRAITFISLVLFITGCQRTIYLSRKNLQEQLINYKIKRATIVLTDNTCIEGYILKIEDNKIYVRHIQNETISYIKTDNVRAIQFVDKKRGIIKFGKAGALNGFIFGCMAGLPESGDCVLTRTERCLYYGLSLAVMFGSVGVILGAIIGEKTLILIQDKEELDNGFTCKSFIK